MKLCPSDASADGVASFTMPAPIAMLMGLPCAIVCVPEPSVNVLVGPKWLTPVFAGIVCTTSVGASKIHSADDWVDW